MRVRPQHVLSDRRPAQAHQTEIPASCDVIMRCSLAALSSGKQQQLHSGLRPAGLWHTWRTPDCVHVHLGAVLQQKQRSFKMAAFTYVEQRSAAYPVPDIHTRAFPDHVTNDVHT